MSQPLIKGYVQPFEVKDLDSKSGVLVQAYTRYNVVDSDEERGRKGMFQKTWRENMRRIRHLLNHDYQQPIGEPVKFWEDDEYAYMQSQIGTNDDGEDFKRMVESNLIKEASYGYTVIKSNKMKDGTKELIEVKLWEVSSLTGWGANEYTPVISFTKGQDKSKLFDELTEKYLALESFCYNSTATDKTLQKLELERDQIKSFLKTLLIKTGTEAVHHENETLQPRLKKDDVLSTRHFQALKGQLEAMKQQTFLTT